MSFPKRLMTWTGGGLLALAWLAGCGSSAGPARLSVDRASLEFVAIDCTGGAPSAPTSVRLTNTGGGPLDWKATVDGPFAVNGAVGGQIAGGQAMTLSVRASIAPAGTYAQATVTGHLHVTTTDPLAPETTIDLSATAHGAELSLVPATANFGDVSLGKQATMPVALYNDGNATVQATLGAPTHPAFSVSADVLTLAPKQAASAVVSFAAQAVLAASGTSTLTITGPACHAPTELKMLANANDALVGVSPGALDFGLVDCGSQAKPQSVVLSNVGPSPFHFNAILKSGYAFDLSTVEGIVPAQGSITIVITPKAIVAPVLTTPDGFGDLLEISTSAPNDVAHLVPIHETAHGGAVTLAPGVVDFGRQRVGQSVSTNVTVHNTGNAVVQLDAIAIGGYGAPSTTIPPGDTAVALSYTADPTALGTADARTLVASFSGTVCSAPVVMKLSAAPFDRAAKIFTGGGNTCLVSLAGRVYCSGTGYSGQLLGKPSSLIPMYIPGVTATDVACSGDACCAVQSGTIRCWGTPYGSSVVPFGATTDAVAVMGGGGYLALRTSSGVIATWKSLAACGCGQLLYSPDPVAMTGVTDAVDYGGAFAGPTHACVARASGEVVCAGYNVNGDLGSGGSYVQYLATTPETVLNLTNATNVAASSSASCARRSDGSVSCWGSSAVSDPGGTSNYNDVATPIAGIVDAVDVAMTETGACALRSGGGVKCWGYGVLGNGTNYYNGSVGPVDVSGLSDAASLAGGMYMSCIVRTDGRAACWGFPSGNPGEFPDGLSLVGPRLVPVAVVGFD